MRQREKGGVVDSRLNVYGVQGLKVAGQSILLIVTGIFIQHGNQLDLSIAPSNVGAVSTYTVMHLLGRISELWSYRTHTLQL